MAAMLLPVSGDEFSQELLDALGVDWKSHPVLNVTIICKPDEVVRAIVEIEMTPAACKVVLDAAKKSIDPETYTYPGCGHKVNYAEWKNWRHHPCPAYAEVKPLPVAAELESMGDNPFVRHAKKLHGIP